MTRKREDYHNEQGIQGYLEQIQAVLHRCI